MSNGFSLISSFHPAADAIKRAMHSGDTALIIVIAFFATFLGGMALGFMSGIAKGMSLGAHFRAGRPVSPIPWR